MSNGIDELNRYNLGTPQSEQNTQPNTIASAATIAPVHLLTFLTGTVQVANITPPMPGAHLLALVFTNANPSAFLSSGNIQSTKDPAQNELVLLMYDPVSRKYYVVN